MNTTLKRILIIVPCAVLALGILAFAASHVIYGRSLKASVYEIMLRRRYAASRTAEAEIARLESKRTEGERPYALPQGLAFQSDIEESTQNGLQVFTLNGGAGWDTFVIYLHGGAYINPFNAYQWRFMDRLAREADCPVVAPAYHLAPFADYHDACGDLTGLYTALIGGHPDSHVILMGDSAGGGLAMALAETWARSDIPQPERMILFSPWVDVSMENPDIAPLVDAEPILHLELVKVHGRYWAGDQDTKYWQVSPLYGDMTGLPPTTIYCGTRELLYPDILLAAEKLEAAGVDVSLTVARGLNHDYPLMPIPEGERAVREVVKAIRY